MYTCHKRSTICIIKFVKIYLKLTIKLTALLEYHTVKLTALIECLTSISVRDQMVLANTKILFQHNYHTLSAGIL